MAPSSQQPLREPMMNTKYKSNRIGMGILSDTQNCGLRMPRECRERFPRHRFQRKPLVSDPDMHHGKCVTHDACRDRLPAEARNTFPAFPAHAQPAILYLVRGPWVRFYSLFKSTTHNYPSLNTDSCHQPHCSAYWSNICNRARLTMTSHRDTGSSTGPLSQQRYFDRIRNSTKIYSAVV